MLKSRIPDNLNVPERGAGNAGLPAMKNGLVRGEGISGLLDKILEGGAW